MTTATYRPAPTRGTRPACLDCGAPVGRSALRCRPCALATYAHTQPGRVFTEEHKQALKEGRKRATAQRPAIAKLCLNPDCGTSFETKFCWTQYCSRACRRRMEKRQRGDGPLLVRDRVEIEQDEAAMAAIPDCDTCRHAELRHGVRMCTLQRASYCKPGLFGHLHQAAR